MPTNVPTFLLFVERRREINLKSHPNLVSFCSLFVSYNYMPLRQCAYRHKILISIVVRVVIKRKSTSNPIKKLLAFKYIMYVLPNIFIGQEFLI